VLGTHAAKQASVGWLRVGWLQLAGSCPQLAWGGCVCTSTIETGEEHLTLSRQALHTSHAQSTQLRTTPPLCLHSLHCPTVHTCSPERVR
jgi:hypothetical protein